MLGRSSAADPPALSPILAEVEPKARVWPLDVTFRKGDGGKTIQRMTGHGKSLTEAIQEIEPGIAHFEQTNGWKYISCEEAAIAY